MEVLKLCVIQGVQASNLSVPILAEELECAGEKAARAKRISSRWNLESWSDISQKRSRARTARSGVQRDDVPS